MTPIFYYTIYLIIYVFNLFVVRRFMNAFFERRKSSLVITVGAYTFYYIVTSVLYLFVNIPMITLLCNLGGLFLISLNYESTMRKRLFSILSIYLFLFLSEIIVVAFSGIYSFRVVEKAEYIDLIWHFVIQLTTYLASILVSAFKNIKKNRLLSTAIFATGVFIFGLSLYFVLTILDSQETTQLKALSTIIAVILMNVVVFFLYDKLSDSYQVQLNMRSCIIVLVGATTFTRKWVKYEIKRAYELNKGILGIYVHNLKDKQGVQCEKGENPFEYIFTGNGKQLADYVKCYNPPCRSSKSVYEYIEENIEDWIEDAIENKAP